MRISFMRLIDIFPNTCTPPPPPRTHLTWVFQDYMLPGNMCFVQGPVSWKRLKHLNVPDFSADTGPCAHSCQKFPYLIHTITQYKLHVTHAYIDQLASFAQKTYIPSVVYECLCFHSDREQKKPRIDQIMIISGSPRRMGGGVRWFTSNLVCSLSSTNTSACIPHNEISMHDPSFILTIERSSQRTQNNLYLLDMLHAIFTSQSHFICNLNIL